MNIHQSKQGRYSLRVGTDGVFLLKSSRPALHGDRRGRAHQRECMAPRLARQPFRSTSVWIDQALWFDLTDAAPLVAQGTVGVSAKDGSRVSIDNVLVTQNQGALPSGTIAAPAPLANAPSAAEVVEEQAVEETAGTGGQPDLVVSQVNFDPSPWSRDKPFTANYLIENQGSGDSGAFTFRLHFHASAGIADCDMDVDNLAPGLPAWGGCVRTVTNKAGNYPVEATADIENEVAESNEGNNQNTLTMGVGTVTSDSGGEMGSGGGQPDLVITSGKFNPAAAREG